MVIGGDFMTIAVKMDVMPESQIQAMGIEALKNKLGVLIFCVDS